ncbi:MAG: hypothetical protein OXC80_10725 [Gammaproteobacteria bacterium]|nr:hypothetical protein [Gammaproteobacteria bacterium]
MVFTVDTNLLAFITPRRFLMGVAAYLSAPIFLPPTVAMETKRRMFERTVVHDTKRSRRPPPEAGEDAAAQYEMLIQNAVDQFVDEDLPDAHGIFCVRTLVVLMWLLWRIKSLNGYSQWGCP